jgi:hypothetical protein
MHAHSRLTLQVGTRRRGQKPSTQSKLDEIASAFNVSNPTDAERNSSASLVREHPQRTTSGECNGPVKDGDG